MDIEKVHTLKEAAEIRNAIDAGLPDCEIKNLFDEAVRIALDDDK